MNVARLLVGENGQIKIVQITNVPTTNVHVAPVKTPKTDLLFTVAFRLTVRVAFLPVTQMAVQWEVQL